MMNFLFFIAGYLLSTIILGFSLRKKWKSDLKASQEALCAVCPYKHTATHNGDSTVVTADDYSSTQN